MAMALALRRLSSSVNKQIRPLFNGGSLYYMVHFIFLAFYVFSTGFCLVLGTLGEKEKKKKLGTGFIVSSFVSFMHATC